MGVWPLPRLAPRAWASRGRRFGGGPRVAEAEEPSAQHMGNRVGGDSMAGEATHRSFKRPATTPERPTLHDSRAHKQSAGA